MINTQLVRLGLPTILLALLSLPAAAQSFRVQCPASTITHPTSVAGVNNNAEPTYTRPTTLGLNSQGFFAPTANVNGAIKCQQISGGDGYASMADGTQTYMFSFGPLSGIGAIATGQPGTEFPNVFDSVYGGQMLAPGDPATTVVGAADGAISPGGSVPALTTTQYATVANFYNGAIGLVPDLDNASAIDGHVDPRQIMDVGVMNGNIPAPLMAIDEDDEFFLTLTNVGMIMRPDLFEQHTVHFHGYPNASSFYDGVPDASVAINIGASFTYYYLAPDAGTYFWHCHITPPEHLQMGMVGQIYVRPRQDRVAGGASLYTSLQMQQGDLRTACNSAADILCSNPLPNANNGVVRDGTLYPAPAAAVPVPPLKYAVNYAYNDGDGSTAYDVEYPIQIHGFDPNFHFVGMTFNPEGFADMKDKYFILNGRSYPDTVTPGPLQTQSSDGVDHFSQPLPSIINIPAGKKALLRISDLDVVEFQTLASLGIPMQVIALNAKLLRDQAGVNLYYNTNSITLGGGESLDVILDACKVRASDGSCTTAYTAGDTYYLYTPNLDHLSNDAENFGGLMTEIHICGSVDPTTKTCGA